MKIFLKTMLSGALAAAVLSAPMPQLPVSAEENTSLTANYDSDNRILSVKGITEKACEAITVRICKYNGLNVYSNEPDTNKNNRVDAGEPILFKTVTGSKDRSISTNIKLDPSGKIPQGRYKYDVGNNKEWLTGGTLVLLDTEKLSPEIKKAMNDGKDAIEKLISDGGEIYAMMDDGKTKDISYMAEVINNIKPNGGYGADSFLNAYLIAEGIYHFHAENIDFAVLLSEYADVIGNESINAYNALPDKTVKEHVQTLFKQNIVRRPIDKEFKANIFAARYFSAKEIDEFKNNLLEYINGLENDPAPEFDSLNSYNRDKVITALYNVKKDLVSADVIINDFNEETEKVYADQKKDEDNKNSGKGSGGSGGGKRTNTVPIGNISNNRPGEGSETNVELKDIQGHWAEETIKNMVKLKYLKGFEDGTFRPDEAVSRAEFIAVICRILNIDAPAESSFEDVSSKDWFSRYIQAAYQKNLIYGSGGKFFPHSKITREDAAVILKRVLDAQSVSTNISPVSYADSGQIADYAQEAINALSNANMMTGYNECVKPKDNLTRAEAATLLYRFMSMIK